MLVQRNYRTPPRAFAYDLCFDEKATQQQIFDGLGVDILQNSINVSEKTNHKLKRKRKERVKLLCVGFI